jgi:hypothetical protein
MKRLAGLMSAAALVFTVGCAQTDSGITTNVKAKFAVDDVVKANEINVDTKDHIVTLSGDVRSEAAKHRAVEIASTTGGVRDVIDRMTVHETAATSGTLDTFGNDIREGGDVLKHGAEQTGDAIKDTAKDAGEKVKSGANKVGGAVTDKDRDSDKDGH